jgi:hypothetical protein
MKKYLVDSVTGHVYSNKYDAYDHNDDNSFLFSDIDLAVYNIKLEIGLPLSWKERDYNYAVEQIRIENQKYKLGIITSDYDL